MPSLKNLTANPLQSPQATRWIVVAITWVAFLLRTINLATQSLWRDEVDAIRFSSWTLRELVTGLFRTGHNGPLFFLLLRPWRSLTGDSEFALRYPSALLGAVLIPLGFILARQLGFKRRVGLLLGLLLATSPYLVWYGQEAKMYALLVALIMLAFIAYLKALTGASLPSPFNRSRRDWRWMWWVVFVVTMTLSFYTHILSPLMLAVYTVVGLLSWPVWRQHWRGWAISMACLTLPYIPLALWQMPLLLDGFQSGHSFYPFPQQIYLLLQLYSSGLLRFVGLTAIILFVFLFLCGLFLGNNVKRASHALTTGPNSSIRSLSISNRLTFDPYARPGIRRGILAVWVLLPALLVYFISLRVAIFEDRYLIYITPAFYLLIVLGLVVVRQHARWLAGICLAALLAINLTGIWQQQRRPLKADFRAAAAYLAHQPQPPTTIMIQTPYLQYTLNYYYKPKYTLLEGLWTNNDKDEATVDHEMTGLTAGLTDLWLVVSEEDLWDNRHLTRSWLDQHANKVDEAHFMRVDLYHYQLEP